MYKKIYLLIIFIIPMFLLTSCYDAREIDDNIYVLTIGIDKGVSDKWRLTFQFNSMQGGMGSGSGSSDSGGSSENYSVVTVDAPSFFGGTNMLNASLSRRINFAHAEYLVVSEDVAKSGALSEIIAPLIRYRETRRTMNFIISKGSAQEFVQANKPYVGRLLSKNQQGLVDESDDTGFFPRTTLNDLYNSIKSPYRQPMAILGAVNNGEKFRQDGKNLGESPRLPIRYYAGELPRKGENKIEFFGCAIGNGSKFVGELNGAETRALLMARGEFKRGVITTIDPQSPNLVIPINLIQDRRPKVTLAFNNGKPVIHLSIELEGDIYAIQSKFNYADPKLKPILERSFEKDVKRELDIVVSKCKSLNCDVFNFGYYAVRHFKTIQEWEAYNWNKHFAEADITTDVKFNIRRAGSILKIAPEIEVEGKY